MPSIEEMSAWSLDELRAALTTLLPTGWSYREASDPGGFFTAELQDEKGNTVWEDAHIDRRILLFDLYGQVWRKQPRKRHSAWASRGDAARVPVVSTPRVADPEDLDPDEVSSVYAGFNRKGNT